MSCNKQQRGIVTRVVIDRETGCPGTAPAFASRKPVIIPFNSVNPGINGPEQIAVDTIRASRQRTEPFQGFGDYQPVLDVPLDSHLQGIFLGAELGLPVSYPSAPNALSPATTITITGGGGYTFSDDQSFDPEDEIIIVYRKGTGIAIAGATAPDQSFNVGEIKVAITSGALEVITAAEVIAILPPANVVINDGSLDGDLDVSGGVFTLTANVALVAGSIIYYGGNAYTVTAITQEWNDTDIVGTAIDGFGFPAPDVTGEDLDAAILSGVEFTHEFTAKDTERLPSYVLEVGYTDIEVPVYLRYGGVRVSETTLNVSGGSGDQLVKTLNMMATSLSTTYQPYDAADHMATTPGTLSISSGTATATSNHTNSAVGDWVVYTLGGIYYRAKIATRASGTSFTLVKADGTIPANIAAATVVAIYPDASAAKTREGSRFDMRKATLSLGGVNGRLTEATFTLNNNLDPETYEADGTGDRADFNEGFIDFGGDFTARFTDTRILNVGLNDATTTMGLSLLAANSDTLTYSAPSTKHNNNAPEVSGPAGVVYTTTWTSYYQTDGDPQVSATLTNDWSSYA